MNGISIIMPCEQNRVSLLKITLKKYLEFGFNDVEFIIPTRTIIDIKEIIEDESFSIQLIKYENGGPYFNPARALNLGVQNSKYSNIIITCPEVCPWSNVLQQFSVLPEGAYVAQVFDINIDGVITLSLVNKRYRFQHPGFYFLAMYKKEDIIKINGWDEDFLLGKAYDDSDFGERWVRAGIPFEVREDIQANHMYHLRESTLDSEQINLNKINYNRKNNVIRPKNGLIKE
jgi:hypothetical protein